MAPSSKFSEEVNQTILEDHCSHNGPILEDHCSHVGGERPQNRVLEQDAAAVVGFLLAGVDVHLPDYLGEHFVHSQATLGGGLDERAVPGPGEGHALPHRHFPLVVQVYLQQKERANLEAMEDSFVALLVILVCMFVQ